MDGRNKTGVVNGSPADPVTGPTHQFLDQLGSVTGSVPYLPSAIDDGWAWVGNSCNSLN